MQLSHSSMLTLMYSLWKIIIYHSPYHTGKQQWRNLLQCSGEPVYSWAFPPQWQSVVYCSFMGWCAQWDPWGCVLSWDHRARDPCKSFSRCQEVYQEYALLYCYLGFYCHLEPGHVLWRQSDNTGKARRSTPIFSPFIMKEHISSAI